MPKKKTCTNHDLPIVCGFPDCGVDDWPDLAEWEPGKRMLHYPKGVGGWEPNAPKFHALVPAHLKDGRLVLCGLRD